jgi:hypothetical protein
MDNYNLLFSILDSYEDMRSATTTCQYINKCMPYLTSSPTHNGCYRILHTAGHETNPDFLGSWLPRNDHEDNYSYCACVLLLLKPW